MPRFDGGGILYSTTEKALHVAAPLVQDVIGVSGLGEADNARWSVNLGVDRLGGDQVTDVLLRFIFGQIQQLRETAHLDASVILGYNADVVLDYTLAKILPALVRLLIRRLTSLGVENVGLAEIRAEPLGHFGPPHKLMNCEELQNLLLDGHLGIARVTQDSVQEVMLLVVVGCEDDKVNDALENLETELAIPGADLPAQNASLGPVSALDAQGDLRKDELCLFSPVHGTKRFHLQFAQNLCRGLEVALFLLDIGQNLGNARALDFDEDLALGDSP
ncbi:hypothetical protein BN1708_013510 [Verticillium longisporum]|uniref:Uncharacterized protein n=1 Tax=Verticillium longisporum TaxID=100787 RepID=A0A0G4LLH8_VERLO|nr:hypothetical protein BN1708_013510 [Verticillium longisporum]